MAPESYIPTSLPLIYLHSVVPLQNGRESIVISFYSDFLLFYRTVANSAAQRNVAMNPIWSKFAFFVSV